jgi:hypothetical protein
MKWGPGPNPQHEQVQTGPFAFPLYCGETSFTAHVFEPGGDTSNKETAKIHKTVSHTGLFLHENLTLQCTVHGGAVETETPLFVLNIQSEAPYFKIVDLGLLPDLTFTGDCGNIVKPAGVGGCQAPAGQSRSHSFQPLADVQSSAI